MKSNPSISGVDVYVPENSPPLIAYGFLMPNGKTETAVIAISIPLDGAVHYSGDFHQVGNPLVCS
jgi:hypothetical protein